MTLNEYLENIEQVEGWCTPELWNCIEPIDLYQRVNNISGPIAEIGVYHGKFFIGLALTKLNESGHCAFDVFDQQEFNLDKAGVGSLDIFKRNLKKYNINDFEAITVDSLRITDDLLDKYKNTFSLFSVDGCHKKEHTIKDFQTAMKMVNKDGVIFIDDYYNPNWPEVQEGITKYYLHNTPDFVPFLYTCNKLFLCSLSRHNGYLTAVHDFLTKQYKSSRVKVVNRFGYKTLTVLPNRREKKYLASKTLDAVAGQV